MGVAINYAPPAPLTSGATFSQLQSGSLAGVLDLLVTANPAIANPTTAPTVSTTGGGQTLSNPTVAATVSTSSGASATSLASGTYYATYTFIHKYGETTDGTAHAAQSTVFTLVNGTSQPRVTTPAIPAGATGINVYLTAANGAAGTEVLYGTITSGTTLDLISATYAGPTTTVPATNTTAGGLPAGTYFVSYAWDTAVGRTLTKEVTSSFTTSSGNIPRVTLPTFPPGVTMARIYLTAASGATGTETFYGISTATTFDLAVATWANALKGFPATNSTALSAISPYVMKGRRGRMQDLYTAFVQELHAYLSGSPIEQNSALDKLEQYDAAFTAVAQAVHDTVKLCFANTGTITTTASTYHSSPTVVRTFP